MNIEVKDGQLMISIYLASLQCAAEYMPGLEYYVDKSGQFLTPCVNNLTGFAQDVVVELKREDEDGTTLVHRMLDAAVLSAIESGSQHITY